MLYPCAVMRICAVLESSAGRAMANWRPVYECRLHSLPRNDATSHACYLLETVEMLKKALLESLLWLADKNIGCVFEYPMCTTPG